MTSEATVKNDFIDTSGGQTQDTVIASGGSTIVPGFAIDAANAKIESWSGAIVEAAEAIERLVSSESLPVPDGIRDLATSTTQKLRDFGTRSGDYDAADLVAGLQRKAAAHPAAAIGVGAAIGATLATLLVRVGSSPPPSKEPISEP